MCRPLSFTLLYLASALVSLVVFPPLMLFIYVPFWLMRQTVVSLAKVLRPDLIKIVGARDAVLANDDYAGSPKSTIVISHEVNGKFDIETLREIVLARIVLRLDDSHGSLKFPEFQQYFVSWGGYLFRKQEHDFRIEEHVKFWKRKDDSGSAPLGPFPQDADLYEIRAQLLTEPYGREKSPWEIILVQNAGADTTTTSKCFVLAKFHHGSVDGYSLLNIFFSSLVKPGEGEAVKPKFVQRSTLERTLFLSKSFLLAPYALGSQVPKFEVENPFNPTAVKLSGKRHPAWDNLPLRTIKEISRQSGTSFAGVLMAGMGGGIKSYLESNKKPVPKSIDVALPLPWPGHPNKSRNHFTFATVELPCDSQPNIQSRLQAVQEILMELKKSVIPAVNFGLVPLTGGLPSGILKILLENTPNSILMSNFPGPQDKFDLFEHELLAPYFEGGYGQSPLGMGVSMVSYNQRVFIAINPEAAIIPTRLKSQELLQHIMNQFHLMTLEWIV